MRINPLFLLDIILYFIFPLLFWNVGRDYFGDYITILFSTVPGILYTLYRFKMTENFNFTGLFIIFNLSSGIVVDVLSGSAIQLLWNDVYVSLFLAVIYFLSYLLKKPIHLYFTLDILVLRGYDKSFTKEQLYEKKTLLLLNSITLLYCIIECGYAFIMVNWISMYGLEAYQLDIIFDNVVNVVMTGISIISFIFLNNMIDEILPLNKNRTIKNLLSYTNKRNQFPLERSYFYFCNQNR